jgi:hypothetical protein
MRSRGSEFQVDLLEVGESELGEAKETSSSILGTG